MDELYGSDIHAPGWLTDNKNFRIPVNFACKNDLLLIPSREVPCLQIRAGRADVEFPDAGRPYRCAWLGYP